MASEKRSSFALLLSQYRIAAGLTQEELAERAALSVRGISDLERGIRRRPRLHTIWQLAEALRLSADERSIFKEAAHLFSPTAPDWTLASTCPLGTILEARAEGIMVARENEMAAVRQAISAVTSGSGHPVLLHGEPGVGKTRLAQAVVQVVMTEGFTVATGTCLEPRQTIPYYPFLGALAALHASASATLRLHARKHWPYLGHLVPMLGSIPPTIPATGQQEQETLFQSVIAFIQALAEETPVAFLLDDLHWADESSLELLRQIAYLTRSAPVFLLGTYRDEEVGPQAPLWRLLRDMHRRQLVAQIPVRRLSTEETAALVAVDLHQTQVPAEIASLVYRHAEGNPFFTRELLRSLVERGDVFMRAGRWERRSAAEIVVPESVRMVIEERLTRRRENVRQILREASILGQRFQFEDLRLLGRRAETEVEEALEDATAAGLIHPGSGESYVFSHALTQQTLYDGLSPRRRKRLHHAAGVALEELPKPSLQRRVAELAWHFRLGGDQGRALQYTLLAGVQAEAIFAHAEAEQHYRVAVDLARELDDRVSEGQILERLGTIRITMGRYDEALACLQSSAEIYVREGNLDALGGVTAKMGRANAFRGTPDQAVVSIQWLLDRFEPSPSYDPARARLYTELARVYFFSGRYQEQLTACECGLELARAIEDHQLRAEVEVRRGVALGMLGRRADAIRVTEDVLPLVETVGDQATMVRAYQNLGEMYLEAGELPKSRLYMEQALRYGERLGDPGEQSHNLAHYAHLLFLHGDWRDALEAAERAMSLLGDSRSWFAAYPLWMLGQVGLARGDATAGRRLTDALEIAERSDDVQALSLVHRVLAEHAILGGRADETRLRLEPLVDRSRLGKALVTPLLSVLGWALLEMGAHHEAEVRLAAGITQARRQGLVIALVDGLRVQGMLLTRQARLRAAQSAFDEALHLSSSMPYPSGQAEVLHEWALLDIRQGNLPRARERLTEACAIFERLGAVPALHRTEQVLADLDG